MHVQYLNCITCHQKFPKEEVIYRCPCGGPLEIILNYHEIKRKISWKLLRSRPFTHLRYREFFPIISDKYLISLHEGGTSLIASRKSPNTFYKCESTNLTGSFKDRGSAIEISKALERGKKKIVLASTGNMGASVSAYSAAAGLQCHVYTPSNLTKAKQKQITIYGSKITKTKGDYMYAARRAYRDYELGRAYLCGDYAYRAEGTKSVAFEIFDELTPDYILLPMGNGTLIGAVWKAAQEFYHLKLITKLPRLIGVQVRNCSPLVKAFRTHTTPKPFPARKTIASAIDVADPLDGLKALHALQESGGQALAVSDQQLLQARTRFAHSEGIDAEPSSLAPIVALNKLQLPHHATKVVIMTGHGLKDTHNM